MQKILFQKLADLIKKSILKFGVSLKEIDLELEPPKTIIHGDLTTNISLKISALLRKSSLEIASFLKEQISKDISKNPLKKWVEKIEVAGAGFINIFFSQAYYCMVLEMINRKDPRFFYTKAPSKKILIEFVSANPTGPLSIAHGRQAAVGDSLANIFKVLGYRIKKEYYLNDVGKQIELLGKSIQARIHQLKGKYIEFPTEGYHGEYIYDIAKELLKKGILFKKETFFSNYGINYILKTIKKDLKDFGVRFDSWFSEKKLREEKKVLKILKSLKRKGLIYEKDKALWFKSSLFGDDKDRVVIKADKSLTYLASDIAYHNEKFKRGYDWVINLWGPDHHGYISRIKAAVKALGKSEEALSVVIVQLVSLIRGGKTISMSTRRGEYVSLRKLLEEVGKDQARFFFLMRRVSSPLDFDLDLAKRRSQENPLYYIQYAHARISSILRKRRFRISKVKRLSLLVLPEEKDLLQTLVKFPLVLKSCIRQLDPYNLIVYLEDLATYFHRFYDRHRVLTEDRALSEARLYLIQGVRNILATGLKILGVSQPKSM